MKYNREQEKMRSFDMQKEYEKQMRAEMYGEAYHFPFEALVHDTPLEHMQYLHQMKPACSSTNNSSGSSPAAVPTPPVK